MPHRIIVNRINYSNVYSYAWYKLYAACMYMNEKHPVVLCSECHRLEKKVITNNIFRATAPQACVHSTYDMTSITCPFRPTHLFQLISKRNYLFYATKWVFH